MVVWVVGFRHVGGEIGADNGWFSGLIRSWEVVDGEWWCSTAGDESIGDRWSPSLASDAWWTAVTPDDSRWLPARKRESGECRERERDECWGFRCLRPKLPPFLL